MITRMYKNDGVISEEFYDTSESGDWRLLKFMRNEREVFVSLCYLMKTKEFLFYVFMNENYSVTSKFKVHINLDREDGEKDKFQLRVLSITQLVDDYLEVLSPVCSIRFFHTDAIQYFKSFKNQDNKLYSIVFPFRLENLEVIEDLDEQDDKGTEEQQKNNKDMIDETIGEQEHPIGFELEPEDFQEDDFDSSTEIVFHSDDDTVILSDRDVVIEEVD